MDIEVFRPSCPSLRNSPTERLSQDSKTFQNRKKTMTYNELLEQLPLTLTIPTLGGRNSLTVYNLQGGLLVENSKGSTYQLSREDWINAKRIRAAYSRNPWKSRHFTGLTDLYSYSLVYAAALLRHIEPGEADDAEPQNFRRVLQARDAA
jgi:hypothetical protein